MGDNFLVRFAFKKKAAIDFRRIQYKKGGERAKIVLEELRHPWFVISKKRLNDPAFIPHHCLGKMFHLKQFFIQ